MFLAFWMLPASPNFNYNEEVDILEMLGGNTDTAFMTYHYGGRSQSYAVNRGDNNNGACAVEDIQVASPLLASTGNPTLSLGISTA